MCELEKIVIRCKNCNQRLCDYTLQDDDTVLVLQGISFKCCKCKRVLMFKKYTEVMLKHGAVDGNYKA